MKEFLWFGVNLAHTKATKSSLSATDHSGNGTVSTGSGNYDLIYLVSTANAMVSYINAGSLTMNDLWLYTTKDQLHLSQ